MPIAFVATNSITQGEQVAQLWPILFHRFNLCIFFAHRTFAWGSDARGMAHVHVVIIGLVKIDLEPKQKYLFSYDKVEGEPHQSSHNAISAYLFDASGLSDRTIVIKEENEPLNKLPRLIIGSKPIDNGHLIFTEAEKGEFLQREPRAEQFFRPFIGSREFLHGEMRYILYLAKITPEALKLLPEVLERVRLVREFREKSKSPPTRALGKTPTLFHVNVIPDSPFLVIPEVSSERREYIPIAWMSPPTIPSNLVRILSSAKLWHFAILNSAMHMSWVRHIGGRLKSDFRYSIGIVYNTFPLPLADESQLETLQSYATEILEKRSRHHSSSLADLYDPDLMPLDLRKAHAALDRAVDKLYRKNQFTSDRERAEHLFGLYEKMVRPLLGATKVKPSKRAKINRI